MGGRSQGGGGGNMAAPVADATHIARNRRLSKSADMTADDRMLLALGESLRQRRIMAGKTREVLGRDAGMGKTAIWYYENGMSSIPLVAFIKVCAALHVGLEDILQDTIEAVGEVIRVAEAGARELQ